MFQKLHVLNQFRNRLKHVSLQLWPSSDITNHQSIEAARLRANEGRLRNCSVTLQVDRALPFFKRVCAARVIQRLLKELGLTKTLCTWTYSDGQWWLTHWGNMWEWLRGDWRWRLGRLRCERKKKTKLDVAEARHQIPTPLSNSCRSSQFNRTVADEENPTTNNEENPQGNTVQQQTMNKTHKETTCNNKQWIKPTKR
jgi:hypothetical protein